MKEILKDLQTKGLRSLMPGRFAQFDIRTRIFLSLLLVVLLSGVFSIITGVYIINTHIIREAYVTLNNKLNMVINTYNREIKEKHQIFSYISHRRPLKEAILSRDKEALRNKIVELRDYYGFDMVNVTDAEGRILAMANNPDPGGADVSDIAFVKQMIYKKKGGYGTEIIEPDYLLLEGPEIQEQVRVKGKGFKGEGKIEERGLVQWAGYPVIHNEAIIGTIYGCVILNNNNEFVDRMKQIVFTDEEVDGYSVGSTTIFLEDMRIATNIRTRDDKRATGTIISREVSEKVLKEGERWLDEAYVVDRRHLSGYDTLRSTDGSIIGIIYTGILKEKYNRIQKSIAAYFFGVIVLTFCISLIIAIYLSRSIASPVRRLTEASNDIFQGNYVKIKTLSTDPLDMKHLCDAYNRMIDGILERDRKLAESTERKMLHSEKLASIGRLASGIAHEINNPLTGILTFSELLLEDMKGTSAEKDLLVIRNETMRCREIVRGIFEFSRDTKLIKNEENLNYVIDDILTILDKHVSFQDINIIKNFDYSIPAFPMDVIQMKSVISNLSVNAADAMPEGGDLTITTGYKEENQSVFVMISDTGHGISQDNLQKIFDPFFTTKEPGKGTGLGLAVTFGIIRRHNGTIEMKSEPGKGTTAYIEFPVKPENENKRRLS